MRYGNSNTHLGMVNISIEEERVALLPKTPTLRKRWARNKKEKKSAEEVEAGIHCVTAYERQSPNKELVNATPQPHVTPETLHNPSERHNFSKEGDDGNTAHDTPYKPLICLGCS